MDDVARSQPPPRWLQALLNPVLRKVLRTRVGGRIPAALLCFDGRRSGRRFEVPVGVHDAPDGPVVLTPSAGGRTSAAEQTPSSCGTDARRRCAG
jgi:hypothetical protein